MIKKKTKLNVNAKLVKVLYKADTTTEKNDKCLGN